MTGFPVILSLLVCLFDKSSGLLLDSSNSKGHLCSELDKLDCALSYIESSYSEVICDNNGVTYINYCYYSKARCSDPNIHVVSIGHCPSAPSSVSQVCSHLSDPDHGTVSLSGVTPGSQAAFACNQGYNLNSTATLYCLSNGQWSDDSPHCLVMCPFLQAPTNGEITVTSYVPGSMATFTCHNGFKLEGPEHTYCVINGQWSSSNTGCVAINRECPEIQSPRHAIVSAHNKTSGSMVHVQCISGYSLTGSEYRICQDSGQWSGTDPSCQLNG